MSCTGGKITFNPAYYTEQGKLQEIIDTCTASGWWPKNMKSGAIGAHEAAHGIEWYLDNNNPAYQYPRERVHAWNECTEAKAIVSQACKNIKKTPDGKGKINADLLKTISRYGSSNASEAMAESFADVFCNGDEASAMSKEVVKLTTERYKQFGGKGNGW